MVKLIIFDLDGVLVSSKKMHFETLNEALGKERAISWEDHLNKYDGLPTRKKLEMLGVSEHEREKIWKEKQRLSISYIEKNVTEDARLQDLFKELKDRNFKLIIASNSVRASTIRYIVELGVSKYVDRYCSGQDVQKPKPSPEMYLRCMIKGGVSPKETLIVEDSFYGLTAAYASCANVLQVHDPLEVTLDRILEATKGNCAQKHIKWKDDNLKVLIPMAGAGKRFRDKYSFPKPLIEVDGKPMVQRVVESLNIEANYFFIVQREHDIQYPLEIMLGTTVSGASVIPIDGVTEGAACTTLLAEKYIDRVYNPLIIANSDQIIEWNAAETMYEFENGHADALILTFESTHPQWSYVRCNEEGFVVRVAEKQVISNEATVGVYIWRRGSDYVKFARQMIEKNIRYNGEFYVAPVFNEAIADGLKIKTKKVDKMWGLGTPELLERYLNR